MVMNNIPNQTQGVLDRRPALVGPTVEPESQARFKVNVLFTSPKATRSAVNIAAKLAGNLGARIRIIAPHIVPYPLQLNQPAVGPEFTEKKARAIMGDCSLETEIQV